jgi:CRP/FNR family transcriptional regulator
MNVLLKQVSSELVALQERLVCQIQEDAPGQVIHCLLHIAEHIGTNVQKHVRLPIRSSRELLSRLSGLARETVSRVLAHLHKQGLIRLSERQIVIVDLRRLQKTLGR